jgi:hypothetical protein
LKNGASIVPKVMVLVFGDDAAVSPLVDAAVAGANGVRFTEVAVRRAPLHSVDELADMDGAVLVASDGSAADLGALLHDLSHARALDDLVLAVVGDAASLLAAAAAGGILITDHGQESAVERARSVSRRVARVSGWVRHGLGHEAEHRHDHPHSHSH